MATTKNNTYIEAVGRRKTSVARVRIEKTSKPTIVINGKALADFFPTETDQRTVMEALKKVEKDGEYSVSAKVLGGGIRSQAESVRLGISRALLIVDADLRKSLKVEGFLKRDPRAKERRKFGLKKARKAPQWSKR
jgi:small subunit ribosomal protein S9